MTFNYAPLQNTADRLIERFGRDVVLTTVTEGTFNPATDTVTGGGTSEQTIKAVFTDYNQQQIDGSIVKRGDKLVYTFTQPELNDLIDGWKVLNVEAIQPADSTILYKSQVRR